MIIELTYLTTTTTTTKNMMCPINLQSHYCQCISTTDFLAIKLCHKYRFLTRYEYHWPLIVACLNISHQKWAILWPFFNQMKCLCLICTCIEMIWRETSFKFYHPYFFFIQSIVVYFVYGSSTIVCLRANKCCCYHLQLVLFHYHECDAPTVRF